MSSRLISSAFASLLVAAGSLAFVAQAHATAAAASPSDKYPLTTCVVSGDKLGEMGDPVRYVYKQAGQPDRVLEFCCKDCIKDFEKDPAKYLAAYDAAVAGGGVPAAKTSAKTGAMGACCAGDATCGVLSSYTPIAEALAADDLPKAKSAAAKLAQECGSVGAKDVADPAAKIAAATDLGAARAAFKTLSQVLEPMAANAKGYVVMNCPMAKADWIQTDGNVRNPYYGKKMLTCGAPKTADAK